MSLTDATHVAQAPQVKRRAALLSVVSNSTLILLKVVAGTLTGSVAILTEAVHSSIDSCARAVPDRDATSTSMSSSSPAPRSRTHTAQPTSSRT